jgi:predicted phage terminase large subunit-like protein
MFKREYFEIVDALPAGGEFVRYWDKGATKDGGDHTAGVLMAKVNNIFYIVDYISGQWEAAEREKVMRQIAVMDRQLHGNVRIVHEQEPGGGGKDSALHTTRVTFAGFPVSVDKVTTNKEARAEPLASQAEANNVKMIQAKWNRELIDMFCRFPSKPRDGVDASSGAFNKLAIGNTFSVSRYA